MFMRQNGFSMLDLLCLLAGLAGIAAVVLPMMARSRRTSCHASCTNNHDLLMRARARQLPSNSRFAMIGAGLLVGAGVFLGRLGPATPGKVRHEAKRLSSVAAKNLLCQSFEISRCPETHHQTQ
jgi:hypothetical protein